jgi:hypothetical protein
VTAEIEGFIRDAAAKRGIDGDIADKVMRSEGGVDEYCAVGKFSTGWSFWPPQLHYGGPEYPQFGTVAGMGIGFTKLTGWQPGDERAWKDAIRYGFNRARVSGWGMWYGAAAVGVGQWDGIDRDFAFDVNAEIWDFERPIAGALIYNPNQPPERQVQDWTCSIRSTAWCLKSLGLPVDIGDLQDEMVPRYVTPDLGLLDGRGYGIAEVLQAHLPPDWAGRVHVLERVDWGQLWGAAGSGPIALGLHGAYHWIAVARQRADGDLDAPNPAPKYPSAGPIGDILSSSELTAWGPASAVWVDARAETAEPAPPPPPSGTLEQQIEDLQEYIKELETKLGVASSDYARDLDGLARGVQNVATALKALHPPA